MFSKRLGSFNVDGHRPKSLSRSDMNVAVGFNLWSADNKFPSRERRMMFAFGWIAADAAILILVCEADDIFVAPREASA